MASKFHIRIVIIAVILAIQLSSLVTVTFTQESLECTSDYKHVTTLNGNLKIRRNVSSCGYEGKDDTPIFAIRTDNLKLREGDTLQIGSKDNKNSTFKPPFDAGYLFSGYKEPKIQFNFKNLDNTSMEVEFSQDQNLSIDCDINNDFQITFLSMRKLGLSLTKSILEQVLLEVSGAKISGSNLNHALIDKNSTNLSLEFNEEQIVRIKTSVVDNECSGLFSNSDDKPHDISGPTGKSRYKCASLFETDLKLEQAHYQVDFKNFLDTVQPEDRLLLDDGEMKLAISKSNAKEYSGKVIDFRGKQLAVIYNSPQATLKSDLQFKLTVQLRKYGGIIDKEGLLKFPSDSSQIRYVLKPEFQHYAAIEIAPKTKLQDVELKVSSEKREVARFTTEANLPPILVLNEPNSEMILEFTGKGVSKLTPIQFRSLNSSCHKISGESLGAFLLTDGQQNPCYLTLASPKEVIFEIDTGSWKSNGCLAINSLYGGKVIYNRCEIRPGDTIPSFALKQALVNITLQNNTGLGATFSPYPNHFQTISGSDGTMNVISSGYPSSYAWFDGSQDFHLDARNKSYLVTFADVDIRDGEQLKLWGNPVDTASDILVHNTTANFTLLASKTNNDYRPHRGLNITAIQFDMLISTNTTKNHLETPANLSSIFIKISAGKRQRISYNITFKPQKPKKDLKFQLYDGRNMRDPVVDAKNQFHGATSSDTLLIAYRSNQPLLIDYKPVDCNTTNNDHTCDRDTRCVPADWLCKGVSHCNDGTDIKIPCSAGPSPAPTIIEKGVAGVTVFILSVFMLTLGAVSALYGPGLFRALDDRFRSGQYSAFSSVE